MNRIYFIITITTISIISLTFNSCKKTTPDIETQSAVDNSICEEEFNSRLAVINFYASNTQGIKSITSTGTPTITIDTAANSRTMTIDYGTTGTVDSIDGKVRKGQMIVKFDSLWHKNNTIAIVHLNNYYIANSINSAFGQYTVDSIVITKSDSTTFNYNVINGGYSASGYYMLWSSNRTITETAGASTQTNFYDDVYSSIGISEGIDRNGLAYTVTISNPEIKRTICSWIESGRMNLTPSGYSVRTVDYGSFGTCDNKATLIINGNTYTYTLY